MQGGIFAILAVSAAAQDSSTAMQPVPLIVDSGLALRVIMTQKLRFKLNESVHGQLTDPVYAFDREVIPSGTEVTGRLVGFKRPSRWVRAWSLMGGNFTPLREPQIEFESLQLKDGRTVTLQTDVTRGTNTVVRFSDANAPPKGRIATARDMARQQIEARKQAVIDAVKAPGKLSRIGDALLSMLPYRPQSLPSGTRFTATLRAPLDFGSASVQSSALEEARSQAPSIDLVNAVLMTSLDSSTAQHGMAVDAIVSRPVFSADNHLIVPEGSHLTGTVVQAKPARIWHRNGKLAFVFTGIQTPAAGIQVTATVTPVMVEGRLESIEVDSASGDVRLDEEGGATVANSKKRFIAPAIAAALAFRTTEGRDAEPDNDADDVGLKPGQTIGATRNFGPRILAGGIGFGLVGMAFGRLSQPFSSVLGFYGAGRLAYSNIVGKGLEVTFPRNTPLEIRFSSQSSTASNKQN